MTIDYRHAAEADLPALCALGQVVNALHHAAYPDIFAPPSDPMRDVEHWRRGALGAGAVAIVAVEDGVVVGFVNAVVADEQHSLLQPMRVARVGSLVVADGHRGRGIGRQLMAGIEAWARGQGAADLRLNVWAFNAPARALYDELGYDTRLLTLGKALAVEAAPSEGA